MRKAVSIAFIVSLVSIAILLMNCLVVKPFWQNQMIKLAQVRGDRFLGRGEVQRLNIDRLRSGGPWDPYLRGLRHLELARAYRRIGAVDESIDHFRESLKYRVLPDVRMELGFFLIERGRVEEGEAELAKAVRFSSSYLREIHDHQLKERVARLARSRNPL